MLLMLITSLLLTWAPREGKDLIGTEAPALDDGIEWLWGQPESLQGKVVLIRFWLIECPYCRATAPSLVELHEEFADDGLVVIGLHHPKSENARDPEVVQRAAQEYGFTFPIGLDNEWKTINAYGVGTHFKSFTSLSFLIDKDGKIAFVHDGGEYHTGGGKKHKDCNAAYKALRAKIKELL